MKLATFSKGGGPTAIGVVIDGERLAPLDGLAADMIDLIARWGELDRGGHFAAWEQPELLVGEIRTCFRKVR